MKKLIVLLLLALCLVGCSETQVKPTENIADALMPVPSHVIDRFGNDGERTRIIFNVGFTKEFVIAQDKRIAALESQVVSLKKSFNALLPKPPPLVNGIPETKDD